MVPLPPGMASDAPELFGFFVYELRVGHQQGWSTAQGRFGLPLRITGVQHPAPLLACMAGRQKTGITAGAQFATPVFAGKNLLPTPPRSQIWVLLYAQVMQADGASCRNILLGRKEALPQRGQLHPAAFDINPLGVPGLAAWDQNEIALLLQALALRRHSPLSILAVKVLPEIGRRTDATAGNLGYIRILRTSPLTPVPPRAVGGNSATGLRGLLFAACRVAFAVASAEARIESC